MLNGRMGSSKVDATTRVRELQAKPPCPWCGSSSSLVELSRPSWADNAYRRRRHCLECHRDFPTQETLDLLRFARQLEVVGMTLADLGLAVTTGAQDG